MTCSTASPSECALHHAADLSDPLTCFPLLLPRYPLGIFQSRRLLRPVSLTHTEAACLCSFSSSTQLTLICDLIHCRIHCRQGASGMLPFFDNPKHDFLGDVVRALKPGGVLYLEENDVRLFFIILSPPFNPSSSHPPVLTPVPALQPSQVFQLLLSFQHFIEPVPRPRSRAIRLPCEPGRSASCAGLDLAHERSNS